MVLSSFHLTKRLSEGSNQLSFILFANDGPNRMLDLLPELGNSCQTLVL